MHFFVTILKFVKRIHKHMFSHCKHESGCEHAHVVTFQQLVHVNHFALINMHCVQVFWH